MYKNKIYIEFGGIDLTKKTVGRDLDDIIVERAKSQVYKKFIKIKVPFAVTIHILEYL